MDVVFHMVSPDRPIPRDAALPMVASASEHARDQVLLRVDSITKQYADQVVLTDVSFDIQAGEILGIIGPNGAGKTTLLEALAAYYKSARTHRSLHKDAPMFRPIQQIGIIRSHPILGGLHHHYVRV